MSVRSRLAQISCPSPQRRWPAIFLAHSCFLNPEMMNRRLLLLCCALLVTDAVTDMVRPLRFSSASAESPGRPLPSWASSIVRMHARPVACPETRAPDPNRLHAANDFAGLRTRLVTPHFLFALLLSIASSTLSLSSRCSTSAGHSLASGAIVRGCGQWPHHHDIGYGVCDQEGAA